MDPYMFSISNHSANTKQRVGERGQAEAWRILTIIIARSSESSLTMELTVEYRIGLAQPDTPKRYQAKNLSKESVMGDSPSESK